MRDISKYMSTQCYGNLVELQEAARRREIEIELQEKELRQALVQSQPIAE